MSSCKEWDGRRCPDRNGLPSYGYLYVDGERWYAHRWVFFSVHGYLPKVVRHTCDNPPCIEITHLLPGDHRSNMLDAIERSRVKHRSGETHPKAKLTGAQVQNIRTRLSTETPAALAREFGVTHKTIRKIRDGITWR